MAIIYRNDETCKCDADQLPAMMVAGWSRDKPVVELTEEEKEKEAADKEAAKVERKRVKEEKKAAKEKADQEKAEQEKANQEKKDKDPNSEAKDDIVTGDK